MSVRVDEPIVLDLLARAEKRLRGAIGRRGRVDHPEVLAILHHYQAREALLRAVLAAPMEPDADDLMALVDALGVAS